MWPPQPALPSELSPHPVWGTHITGTAHARVGAFQNRQGGCESYRKRERKGGRATSRCSESNSAASRASVSCCKLSCQHTFVTRSPSPIARLWVWMSGCGRPPASAPPAAARLRRASAARAAPHCARTRIAPAARISVSDSTVVNQACLLAASEAFRVDKLSLDLQSSILTAAHTDRRTSLPCRSIRDFSSSFRRRACFSDAFVMSVRRLELDFGEPLDANTPSANMRRRWKDQSMVPMRLLLLDRGGIAMVSWRFNLWHLIYNETDPVHCGLQRLPRPQLQPNTFVRRSRVCRDIW